MLMYFYPSDYTIGTVDAFHVDEKEFLGRVYFINGEEYTKCYTILDNISGCRWWSDIKTRYLNTVHSKYFEITDHLRDQIEVIANYKSPEVKSEYIRKIVGPLNLQDGEAELEKILSNKFKNSPREFTNEETNSEGSSRYGEYSGESGYTNEMEGISNYG